MRSTEDLSPKINQINSAVAVLQKRHNKLGLYSLSFATLFVLSLVAVFVQHDVVYGIFGLTQQVERLHVPASAQEVLMYAAEPTDYFLNLLSWLGWLMLKVFSAFFGAFLLIALLKKIRFFYVRFQSFVLKFVGWLIAAIVIWTSLSYLQYNRDDDQLEWQYTLTHYDQQIAQSDIAQRLQGSAVEQQTQRYLLVQTALLHQPADIILAKSFLDPLLLAENDAARFSSYGFKPEQIWTMQQQVYGQSLTPVAKQWDPVAAKADRVISIVNIINVSIGIASLVVAGLLFLLSSRLKNRILRIQHHLDT